MLTTKKVKAFALTAGFLVAFIFAVVFLGGFPKPVLAGNVGISISPQKFDLTVFPGEGQDIQIRLRNDSSRLLSMSGKAAPFDAREGTGQMTIEESQGGPSRWVEFEESSFTMRPGQESRVNLSIDVPAETNPGGYYLFVYFEAELSSYGMGDTGPKMVPVVGVPVLISTSELILDGKPREKTGPEVTDFAVDGEVRNRFLEDQLSKIIAFASDDVDFYVTRRMPGKFLVTIKNNDLYHIKPEGSLSIYKEEKKLAEGKLKGQTVLPGKTRTFEVQIEDDINNIAAIGEYGARLELESGDIITGEVTKTEANLSFFNIPSMVWIVFALLIGLILIRKRIFLALRSAPLSTDLTKGS